jgi:hypothetical protein
MLPNDRRSLKSQVRKVAQGFRQGPPEAWALLLNAIDRIRPLVEIWRETPWLREMTRDLLLEVGRAHLEGRSADEILAEMRVGQLPDFLMELAQEVIERFPRALLLVAAWSGGILEEQARGVAVQTRHLLRDASALEDKNPAAARELRETAARLTEEHLPRTYVPTDSPKQVIPWRRERVEALFELGLATKYVARVLGHTSDSNVGKMRKSYEAVRRAGDQRPPKTEEG